MRQQCRTASRGRGGAWRWPASGRAAPAAAWSIDRPSGGDGQGHRHAAQAAQGLLQGPPAGDAVAGRPEAELPPEGPERRFAVDRLMPFPFLELPRTEAAFNKAVRRAGQGRGPSALADPGELRSAWWRRSRPATRSRSWPSPTSCRSWWPTCTTRWPSPTTPTARRPTSTGSGSASRASCPRPCRARASSSRTRTPPTCWTTRGRTCSP